AAGAVALCRRAHRPRPRLLGRLPGRRQGPDGGARRGAQPLGGRWPAAAADRAARPRPRAAAGAAHRGAGPAGARRRGVPPPHPAGVPRARGGAPREVRRARRRAPGRGDRGRGPRARRRARRRGGCAMSLWDAVVGQDDVVATLTQAAARPETMTHAWLITGPPGSGRSVAARAFAAALQAPDDPEGTSHEARTAFSGTHADVTVHVTERLIITIEEARTLVETAYRSPAQGRWRVIIIEDADRIAERTSNVLLKAIEEPPPRTVWLLCAPSPMDMLPTIRSRCRQINLRVPDPQAVADLLVR